MHQTSVFKDLCVKQKNSSWRKRNCPELELQSGIRILLPWSHHWSLFCLLLVFGSQVPAWKTSHGLFVMGPLKSNVVHLPLEFYSNIYSMFFSVKRSQDLRFIDLKQCKSWYCKGSKKKAFPSFTPISCDGEFDCEDEGWGELSHSKN